VNNYMGPVATKAMKGYSDEDLREAIDDFKVDGTGKKGRYLRRVLRGIDSRGKSRCNGVLSLRDIVQLNEKTGNKWCCIINCEHVIDYRGSQGREDHRRRSRAIKLR